jgi:hypothetical protein
MVSEQPRCALALALGCGLALAVGCIEKTDPPADDDTTGECVEAPVLVVDVFYNVDSPTWCESEMPGNTSCYECHLCGQTPGAEVDKQHFVCNYCHSEPDGSVPPEGHGSACGCDGLDCSTDPPVLECAECHTDGCNGYVSAQVQRDHCLYCHLGTDEPPW